MNIAIEFGGSNFRSLRREAGRLIAREVSTNYLVLEDSESHRRLLERHGEEFVQCEQGIIVFGAAANDLAEILSLPLQSALDDGTVRKNDPVSRQLLGALVEGLTPAANEQESVCTVVSSQLATDKANQNEHDGLGFLLRLVKLQGHQPHVISPGVGIVLSECGDDGFSGIAIKMGTARMDISIVHHAREIARFFLPRGSHHIDHQLAVMEKQFVRLKDGREVLDTRPIREWRENIENLNNVSDPRSLALRDQYLKLIHQGLHRLKQELSSSTLSQFPSALPMIIGGSLASPAGTGTLFRSAISDADLPIQIESVRKVTDIKFSVLRGGLIAGELNHPDTLSTYAA